MKELIYKSAIQYCIWLILLCISPSLVHAIQPEVRGRVVNVLGAPLIDRLVQWEDCIDHGPSCIPTHRYTFTDDQGYFVFKSWSDPNVRQQESTTKLPIANPGSGHLFDYAVYVESTWGEDSTGGIDYGDRGYYTSTGIPSAQNKIRDGSGYGCGENDHKFTLVTRSYLYPPLDCTQQSFTQIQNNTGLVDIGNIVCKPFATPTPEVSPINLKAVSITRTSHYTINYCNTGGSKTSTSFAMSVENTKNRRLITSSEQIPSSDVNCTTTISKTISCQALGDINCNEETHIQVKLNFDNAVFEPDTSDNVIEVLFPAIPEEPYYKLKNASFNRKKRIDMVIPANPTAFDADDTAEPYMMIGTSGLVTSKGDIHINSPSRTVSSNNWQRSHYLVTTDTFQDLTAFIDFAKTQKKSVLISDLQSIQNHIFNIYTQSLILNQSETLPLRGPYVLAIQGDLKIESGTSQDKSVFNENKEAVAILVTGTLTIDDSIRELNGIFIANAVKFTSSEISSTPLKINGNLISNTEAKVTRSQTSDKPSLFISFKPEMYIELLPYLTTIRTERKIIR